MADLIFQSYGDVSRVTDVVLNAIEILTAKENYLLNSLGKTVAKDTVHSYLTDTLKAAAANAVGEVTDFTLNTRTAPSKLTNLVQIIAIPFAVSRTQQQIEHFHGQNELERQTQKALIEWANDAEFAIVRSTYVTGLSGTAPAMSGLLEAVSGTGNYTAHNSGTAFSATILSGLMKMNWDVSNGDVATDVFMGSYLKNVADSFVQKSNVVVQGTMTTLVNTVSVLTTSFGTVALHAHRYIQQSSDSATAGRVLGLNPEKLKIAYLQKPTIDTTLSRSGDYDTRAVVGKLTLEVHAKLSNFIATGCFIG